MEVKLCMRVKIWMGMKSKVDSEAPKQPRKRSQHSEELS